MDTRSFRHGVSSRVSLVEALRASLLGGSRVAIPFAVPGAISIAVSIALLVSLFGASCTIRQFTARRTAEITGHASFAVESHWDYEFIGQAMPANLVQIEGLLQVDPENRQLLLRITRGYSGYAFGWVEDAWERAELEGELDRADHARRRANAFHKRAYRYGFRLLQKVDDGFASLGLEDRGWASSTAPEKVGRDVELRCRREVRKKQYAEDLIWTATALASVVRTSDSPGLHMSKLAVAKALASCGIALDPTVGDAAGVVLVAAIEAQAPEPVGGNIKRSKALFEEAMAQTDGASMTVPLQYALNYAVKTEDRGLFQRLLRQVLWGKPSAPRNRLTNLIARRRAERAWLRTEELFLGE